MVGKLVGHEAFKVLQGLGARRQQRDSLGRQHNKKKIDCVHNMTSYGISIRYYLTVDVDGHQGIVRGDIGIEEVLGGIVLDQVEGGRKSSITRRRSGGRNRRSDPAGVLGRKGLPICRRQVSYGGSRLLALIRGRPVQVFSVGA